jgi:hypothetical protein
VNADFFKFQHFTPDPRESLLQRSAGSDKSPFQLRPGLVRYG